MATKTPIIPAIWIIDAVALAVTLRVAWGGSASGCPAAIGFALIISHIAVL
jgi:hypothetical protein